MLRPRKIHSLALSPNLARSVTGTCDSTRQPKGCSSSRRDGFAELVGGNLQAAKNFFENQYLTKISPTDPAAIRYAVTYGLAEVRRRDGKLREAELLFATVAAIDYSNRDRVAAALVGQAQCAKSIADSDSNARFKALLQTVIKDYGDTPAAR